jgi:4-hydroxythreonine-4-phosphate dehydrogenase
MKKKIIAGISLGDFNGIGIEVILKSFKDNRVLEDITPIIYAKDDLLRQYIDLIPELNVSFEIIKSANEAQDQKVNLINITTSNYKCNPGKDSLEAGEFAYLSLKSVTDDLSKGLIDVLITAPINKKNIQTENFKFPGHTEYLTSMSNIDQSLMFMIDHELRVGLATNHVGIKDINSALSKDIIIEKILLMKNSLELDFNIPNPKIAVLGLNPHAGDLGLIGQEEIDIITPAISKAKESGVLAWGPFPADGFFGNAIYQKFDGVLAMYHDQGLIAFKTISNNKGVNFTAGLPIVRTSPDHGTGMDISGKGIADEESFRNALYLAKNIFIRRAEAKKLKGNKLALSAS